MFHVRTVWNSVKNIKFPSRILLLFSLCPQRCKEYSLFYKRKYISYIFPWVFASSSVFLCHIFIFFYFLFLRIFYFPHSRSQSAAQFHFRWYFFFLYKYFGYLYALAISSIVTQQQCSGQYKHWFNFTIIINLFSVNRKSSPEIPSYCSHILCIFYFF